MTDPAHADMIVALFGDALEAASDGADPPRAENVPRKAAEMLSEWSARYPSLEADFTGAAVEAWADSAEAGRRLSPAEEFPIDAAAIVRQARRNLASRETTPADSSNPALASTGNISNRSDRTVAPAGLKAAAQANGIGYPGELASRLRLPPAVLERLTGNQFDPKSLPVVLIQQIATVVRAHRRDVADWLAGPAATGHAGMYPAMVSEARAPYGSTPRFSDVVSQGDDWADADREFWLSAIRFSRLTEEPGGGRNDEP